MDHVSHLFVVKIELMFETRENKRKRAGIWPFIKQKLVLPERSKIVVNVDAKTDLVEYIFEKRRSKTFMKLTDLVIVAI